MRKFSFKLVFILGGFFLLAPSLTLAQPPRAKERLKDLKKIKLLEVLNLDEHSADKFLVKYNAWESKLETKKDEVEKAADELEKSIKDSESEETISQKTQKYLEIQNDMLKLVTDRNNDLKPLLTKVQFGKYVLFEHKFMQEVQKILFKHFKGQKQGRNP